MTDEELIKAAAERVMGWEIISQRHFCRTGGIAGEDAVEMSWDIYPLVRENPAPSVWNPLTSDNDCWQLVDAIKARQKAAFVLGSNGHYDQWSAWIIDGTWALGRQQNSVPDHGDPHLLGSATSSDRRRAIVLAALKACGVEV